MRLFFLLIAATGFCSSLSAQPALQQLSDSDRTLSREITDRGMRAAFMEALTDDAVIFRPAAVNGKDFWRLQADSLTPIVIRNFTSMDISANGLLGYTTGSWELYTKSKSDPPKEIGQYVTIWEKRLDGKFRATIDITIAHDKPADTLADPGRVWPTNFAGDINKRRWSAADPSMNFLKMSMTKKALGGAYDKFAGPDIRLLREGEPPILGKKKAVSATKDFISIDYPKKVAMLEASDMAYVWNPCEYANSEEGKEKGTCLHVWKLRNKQWYIVLGVLARVRNETKPSLKTRYTGKNPQ
jgi:ketosteroid isomerase-like protein